MNATSRADAFLGSPIIEWFGGLFGIPNGTLVIIVLISIAIGVLLLLVCCVSICWSRCGRRRHYAYETPLESVAE